MQSLTYIGLERLLNESHSAIEAAEAHGILAGALSAGAPYALEDWARDADLRAGANAELTSALTALYEQTVQALQGEDLQFTPFLPDDEDPILRRVRALAEWCHGFLQGFNANRPKDAGTLAPDIDEVLKDLKEITRVDLVDLPESEESETAYAELMEFVRVGGQLVFEETRRAAQPGTPPRQVN